MNHKLTYLTLFTTVLTPVISSTGTAHAQTTVTPSSIPSSADPGRLDERFSIQPPPPTVNEKNQSELISTQIPDAPDGFLLKKITLEGANAFPEGYFSDILNEYIDRTVDLNVLNHLTARITEKYRQDGYFLSKAIIPAQEVIDGHVNIVVIEGFIYEVSINDPDNLLKNDSLKIIDEAIERLKKLTPLHGPTLERIILELNDNNALTINSIITAPENKKIPGAIQITLNVKKKDKRLEATYNNHGSRYIGPHQASATYETGNIFNSFDSLIFSSTTSLPTKEVRYGELNYSLPLNANGLKMSTKLSYSSTYPGSTLKQLDVEGDSATFSTGLTYDMIRTRRENWNIGAAFEVKNTSIEFLDQEIIDDKIRSLMFSTQYNKYAYGGTNILSADFKHGLNFLGSTDFNSPKASRSNGRPDFAKIEATVIRAQTVATPNINLVAQAKGQYSAHALLSSEEFGFGGASLGRAYDSSEITGDSGIATSFELNYSGLKPIENTVQFRPFVFYDIGKVWNKGSNEKPISAASAGFGSYYKINDIVDGSVALAYPLTKSVDTPVHGGPDGPRFLFEFNVKF